MPTVEVLPKTAASSGANWTYTTLPPANAVSSSLPVAITGRGARNRQSNFENTAARQRQINSRISDLGKDNYRDAAIPIPKNDTSAAAGGSRASHRNKTNSTQNVRRILTSQKTFVNHLADEEALNPTLRLRLASTNLQSDHEIDIETVPDDHAFSLDDSDNGGPPLGYTRAVSRPSGRPSRTFCEICGYWGIYRCGKCGARYCGLECFGAHQETRCQKFYS